MDKRAISTRQIIIFYCIYFFGLKFLALPSILVRHAGRDAYLSAAIGAVIEFIILTLTVLYISKKKKNESKNKNRILRRCIVCTLAAAALLIFAVQLFIITKQTYTLLENNLFSHLPYFVFLIPLALFGAFFCFSPTRAIFRSGEIFFVFILLGLSISVFPALSSIHPAEVLPVLDGGIMPVLRGAFFNAIFFESFLFLLIFKNEIEVSRHFKKKFLITGAALSAFFVFFVFMFVALFGNAAEFKTNAITNFTLYSAYFSNSGRVDWVITTIWLLLVLLRFGVTVLAGVKCVKTLIKVGKNAQI